MHYDIIIGNPPYQSNDGGGTGSSAVPLYHKFIQLAKALDPQYISYIIPARWYSGGKGLRSFREEMLTDRRISHLVDYNDYATEKCFPGIDIQGGVCYFLWDKSHCGCTKVTNCSYDGGSIAADRALDQYDWFIRHNKAVSIVGKVRAREIAFLDTKVSSRNPFGIEGRKIPDDVDYGDGAIRVYTRQGIRNVGLLCVQRNQDLIDTHKVFMSKAYGVCKIPQMVCTRPIVGGKGDVCSETYLVLDSYASKEGAERMLVYSMTKMFRFLVSLLKNTQNICKEMFSFVPDLPMTEEWTDEKLYERYGLNEGEIAFIVSQVREMRV